MNRLVSGRFRFILYFNPLILLINLVSFVRYKSNFLKDISTENGNLEYITVRKRYFKLASQNHIPHNLPGHKYFVEFMTLTYNMGAYLSKIIDFLNYGFFYDMYHGKRGFAEHLRQPSEQTAWIAVRNSFAYWLELARGCFNESSLEYKAVAYFEKTANEGLRRALTDPDFNSDDLVSLKLSHFIDYCLRSNRRVLSKQPLFSESEWRNIPLKYKKMMTDELIKSMDMDFEKEVSGESQTEIPAGVIIR